MLTQAQEQVLEQIIEAYQNGKRLVDLPDATGSNPFDLLVEVCENGESKKAQLATMLPYVEAQAAYGIEFDTSVSSPTCTRIGNTDLHKSLPIHNRMKGVLLSDAGEVVEYLQPTDWTSQVRDGSKGQVMVEIPAHYRKFLTIGTKRQVWVSELPLPGYHLVPKTYVSAYEATEDRTNHKLASVVNLTAQYRGGDNNAENDGTYKTYLGRPASNISLTDFRTKARARKSGSKEWNCMVYDIQKTLYWLFAVEYATLNTQKAYNGELDANGYKQGGLGAGVTTASSYWSTFNGSHPFVPCGTTDALGNNTGVVDYTFEIDGNGTEKTVSVPRYRGVENPFGHINQWTDGILVQIHPAAGENVSKVFVCSDPAKFSSSAVTDYTHVGNLARTEGYIKKILFGEGGEIMAEEVGGSDSTYFCDYNYTSIPNATELRGVLFGGNAANVSKAGFAFAYSRNTPSYTDSYVGSRLCFIPANA